MVELALKQFAVALEVLRRPTLIVLVLASLSAAGHGVEIGITSQDDLEELSNILGALHHLRGICGYNEGRNWRIQMQHLLDAERPTGEGRDRLVASFNRSYRDSRQTYSTCTPSAHLAMQHLEFRIRLLKPSWQ